MVVMFYNVDVDTELASTEPLFLEEIKRRKAQFFQVIHKE